MRCLISLMQLCISMLTVNILMYVYMEDVIKNKCIFFVVVCTQGTFRPPGHS